MTVLGHTKPVARTLHNCSLCNRAIQPGEQYDRARVIGDDGPYTWKQCAHCQALMRLWGDEIVYDWHEGYGPDSVQEWEPATDTGREALDRYLQRWRDNQGELYPVPEVAA